MDLVWYGKQRLTENIPIYFLASLIPFSYLSILDLRVIIFASLATLAVALQNDLQSYFKLLYKKDLVLMNLLIGYCFFLSQHGYDYFLSLIFFFAFMYWPYLLDHKAVSHSFSLKLKKVYIFGCLFSAGGLLAQVLLDQFFNIEFGYQKVFGGTRNAYGFIWGDFSFLSLYLVTAIPLSFEIYYKKKAYIFSGFFFFASCLTSARTGPFSLILFTTIYFLVLAFRSMQSFLSLKNLVLKFLAVNVFYLLAIRISRIFITRKVTLSGSGRVKDFGDFYSRFSKMSLDFFWGNGFSREKYRAEIGVVPHHFFLDFISMGGVAFLILIFLWSVFFGLSIKKPNTRLLGVISISLIGFNFIPSFFSAYFLAFIFSLLIIDTRVILNE